MKQTCVCVREEMGNVLKHEPGLSGGGSDGLISASPGGGRQNNYL